MRGAVGYGSAQQGAATRAAAAATRVVIGAATTTATAATALTLAGCGGVTGAEAAAAHSSSNSATAAEAAAAHSSSNSASNSCNSKVPSIPTNAQCAGVDVGGLSLAGMVPKASCISN